MIRIVPLDARSWNAFAAFGRSNESSDLRWCWCQYWRLRSKDFGGLKVPELRARLAAEAASPEPPGLVALESGSDAAAGEPGSPERAVGWVSFGPLDAFERIVRSRVIPRVDDRAVWSIVCFSVAESARGRGIGTALLEAAIANARDRGARILEAYPAAVDGDMPISGASAFTGTLPMFERAGFHVVAERASDPASRHPRVVVRREL